ncbi:MAG TPA: glycoside hydrolase family 2 protein [Ignavibacteriales bacterium]|nr:glycoside hydrolase family 2 protein [Ignavibacteriales bacterium]
MENKLELKHNWKLNVGAGNPASFKLNDWLPVSVPGTVHTDLLEHKLIEEPFYNDNEAKQSWICETDWTYQTIFDKPESFSNGLPINLVFEGLDTVGEIYLNGFRLGKTDNMFLRYEYDVTSKLKNIGNILEVRFQSPIRYGKKLEKKYGKLPVALNSERAYIRKAQYSFCWDWGPSFPTMGIWRSIYLIQRDEAYIKNFSFTTKSIKKNKAVIEIGIEAGGNVSGKSVQISLSNGEDKIEKRFDIKNKNQRFEIEVKNPKLWHPNGEGEQNLYDLKIDLLAGDKALDSLEKKAGIRTIELQLKDKGKNTFRFIVNGKHVYAKGVNWIPADSFLPRVDEKKYRMLLQYAKDANMNIVRVWGGGFYENDKFYETCDELGLLVWQDFMFACGGYPEHKEFLDNVTEEVEQNVRRLSYHPSIAIWCGNNENQWIWYQDTGITYKKMPGYKIYHKLIPSLLEKLDPARPYWPSSPFGFEENPNSPLSGNRHEWGIWSRWIDYTEVKNDNSLFVTEFGFQGPANKKTYEKFISDEYRHINSPVFEWHNKQVEGPERIMKFLSGALPVKAEWDDFIYLAQLNQGFALKTCLEHWRMSYPATNGSIIWQINDCWPVASWALIDSELAPKMAYYFVKNIFSRQVVSFSEKGDSIIISALNQKNDKDNINLAVTAYDDNTGALIFGKQVSEKISSWEKKSVLAIANKELPKNNNWTLIATLTDKSTNILFRNYYTKSKWKHKKLAAPDIALSLAEENGKQYVKLTAERPAYFVDLYHPEAEFSDRGFILLPNEEKKVEIISKNPAALRAEDIKIFSLNNYL